MFLFGGCILYQLLQLSPQVLKTKIKNTIIFQEKRKFILALLLRSILLVFFSIFYILFFSSLFGKENNSVAVGSLCILLGIRFVSYGYKIKESLLSLATVLFLMFLGGIVSLLNSLWGVFVFNFLALLVILLLVANRPIMGNAGIYTFSYLFIVETPVENKLILTRFLSLIFVFFICGLILYLKHNKNDRDVCLFDIIRSWNIYNKNSIWQVSLALGVSLALFLGRAFHLSKTVWIGYACMSILLLYDNYKSKKQLFNRVVSRVLAVVIGSILYGYVSSFICEKYTFIIGPVAGLLLGLSGTYFWNNVLNCFGALLLASEIYGIEGSIYYRIENNIIGVAVAMIVFFVFRKLSYYLLNKS